MAIQKSCQPTQIQVADGAMGSELLNRLGLSLNSAMSQQLFDASTCIKQIHAEYISAGATHLLTNTTWFCAEFLKNKWNDEKSSQLLKYACQLAQSVSTLQTKVWLSLGPVGQRLGDYDLSYAFYERIFKVLPNNIFGILLETQIEAIEMQAALAVFSQSKIPLVLSATVLDSGALLNGCAFEKWAEIALAHKLFAWGVNCVSSNLAIKMAKKLQTRDAQTPLWIKPNKRTTDTPDFLKSTKLELIKLNHPLIILGGCCQTSPKEVKQICDDAS